MYCKTCGAVVRDGEKYCMTCGATVDFLNGGISDLPKQDGAPYKGPDGKYRWGYEVSLFKNPDLFFLIWKIFFFIIIGIFAFMVILDAVEQNGSFAERFFSNLKVFGYILIGMTALTLISYLIYAAIMGGKYSVRFEMDEKGIRHLQIPSQASKAEKIGKAAAAAGLAAGNLSAAGAGISSQRTEMYTEFERVLSVKSYPGRHLIKIRASLEHNRVYAAHENFEFVKNYIISRCANLKNK